MEIEEKEGSFICLFRPKGGVLRCLALHVLSVGAGGGSSSVAHDTFAVLLNEFGVDAWTSAFHLNPLTLLTILTFTSYVLTLIPKTLVNSDDDERNELDLLRIENEALRTNINRLSIRLEKQG